MKELRDLYFKVDPNYTGRYTIPLLWDKRRETVVSNESSEIIRMMNTEFNSLLPEKYRKVDLYPSVIQSFGVDLIGISLNDKLFFLPHHISLRETHKS